MERDLRGYELSEEAPWTFSLYYGDGSRLVIPLSHIWFGPPERPVATLFRRHKETGRLVPFALPMELPSAEERGARSPPHHEVVLRKAVPRFDPKLTPQITQALNEAQIVFAATGTLKVLQLQTMNPVLLGAPAAAPAPAATVRRSTTALIERGAVAPASRLVPGGGLAAHEAAGGHLLARHVGLSEARLAERIAAEGKAAVGTFSNRTVAEQVAREAIDANQTVISLWLKSVKGKLELYYVAERPVGQVLLRGADKAVETYTFKLVLVRDAHFALGWRILTGFPVP